MTKPFNVLDYERRGSGGKYKDLYVAACLRDHLIAFPRKGIASPHRVAYCLHHGGIDATLTVDHLCHNPRCCNPAHLRQCTKSENSANPWYKRLAERPAHLPPLKPGRKPITPSLSKEKALSPEREQGTSSLSSPQDDRQRLGSKNESQSVPDQDGAA